MNQNDIDQLTKFLKSAIQTGDWSLVEEAYDYLIDFSDEPDPDEE
jgi:hypothetical protein